MFLPSNMSYGQKILGLAAVTTGVAVALVCSALIYVEYSQSEQRAVRQLESVALLIATHSRAALIFDDNETSAALLMAEEDVLANDEVQVGFDSYLERVSGIGYRTAGLKLLTHWQLPELLTAGLDSRLIPEEDENRARMARVIQYAAHIASSVCAGK